MYVAVIILSILGLAILGFSGLLTLLRQRESDSPYAAPLPPIAEGCARQDAKDDPSSTVSRRNG